MTIIFLATLFAGAPSFSADTVLVKSVVTIGAAEGTDHEVFGYVSAVLESSRGEFMVADMQLSRVQVFDSLGRYVRTIGRRGDGPGEMRRPAGLASVGDDVWVVTDLGQDAFHWFRDPGSPLRRQRRPSRSHAFEAPQGDSQGGLWVSLRPRSHPFGNFPVLRMTLGNPTPTDSMTIPSIPETAVDIVAPERDFSGGVLRVPLTPRTTWTAAEGGVAFSEDGSYRIQLAAGGGGTTETIIDQTDRGSPLIPEGVWSSLFEAQRSRVLSLAERVGVDPARWLGQVKPPQRFPEVIRLLNDPFSRIWVLRADDDGLPLFEVWTSDGRLVGAMALDVERWPVIDVLSAGPRHVLGLFELPLGVHEVRAFPIPPHLRGARE